MEATVGICLTVFKTVAISEAESLTQRTSKTADRGLGVHRWIWHFFVLVPSIAVLVLVIVARITAESIVMHAAIGRERDDEGSQTSVAW
jgi:hypothetical protein